MSMDVFEGCHEIDRIIETMKMNRDIIRQIVLKADPEGGEADAQGIDRDFQMVFKALKFYKENQWHPINPDDPGSFPPVGEDGRSEEIECSCEFFTIPFIGYYFKDEDGGAFFMSESEIPVESHGIVVNAWRPAKGYRDDWRNEP